jgi:uncharacterized protein YidB (DUF937 family)
MANDILGQILGSVLGGGRAGSTDSGSGGLGDLLGALLGGGRDGAEPGGLGGLAGIGRSSADNQGGSALDGKGAALAALMVPLAMQWVQRNGGVAAVLERFKQQGYSRQAASWVSTGENEAVSEQQVGELVGTEELSRLSQQLGAQPDEVAAGMAKVLPEVVNQITPAGEVTADSDDLLSRGLSMFEQLVNVK